MQSASEVLIAYRGPSKPPMQMQMRLPASVCSLVAPQYCVHKASGEEGQSFGIIIDGPSYVESHIGRLKMPRAEVQSKLNFSPTIDSEIWLAGCSHYYSHLRKG